MMLWHWVLSVAALTSCTNAYYLPGVRATDFPTGSKVDVKVNSLTSVKTQLPYEYYSLPFCVPDEGPVQVAESLGEYLSGDRIESSKYKFKTKIDETCQIVCKRTLTADEKKELQESIAQEYRVNM
jgi:transmembrane 9 superfamily protein 2/4